jgi:hypothetical protein
MQHVVRCLAVFIIGTSATVSLAELIEVSGVIKKLDVANRSLVIARTKGNKENVLELEVAEAATLTVDNTASALDAFVVGDEVAITFDSTLEVVTTLSKARAGTANLTKLLRTKFGASKASYDSAKGSLTLLYDFSNPAQLKDFEVPAGGARVGNNALRVAAAEQTTHIVEFAHGSIGGLFAYGNNEGQQVMLGVSGRASVQFHKFNEVWIQLFSEGREIARKDAGPRSPLALQWDVSGKKSRVVIQGKGELAAQRGDVGDIGRFSLHGGNGGLTVSGLRISGVPKNGWLNEFLSR